jgi:hypothetical protein
MTAAFFARFPPRAASFSPIVSGPYSVLGGPGCTGPLAPASSADRHRPPC